MCVESVRNIEAMTTPVNHLQQSSIHTCPSREYIFCFTCMKMDSCMYGKIIAFRSTCNSKKKTGSTSNNYY